MIGHPPRILWTLTLLASSTRPTLLFRNQPSGLILASAFTTTTSSITSKSAISQRQATYSTSTSSTLKMAKSTDDAQKKINNIVVVGGGIQGTSVAYQLAKAAVAAAAADGDGDGTKITILEAKAVASAACGKGGGFMARSWGDGNPTQGLHELAFDMYEELAAELKCESYRSVVSFTWTQGRQPTLSIQRSSSSQLVVGRKPGSILAHGVWRRYRPNHAQGICRANAPACTRNPGGFGKMYRSRDKWRRRRRTNSYWSEIHSWQ